MNGRYTNIPLGERFDNAVHSMNLHTAYTADRLPYTPDGTKQDMSVTSGIYAT